MALSHIHFIGFGLISASFAAAIRSIRPEIKLTAESIDDGPSIGISNGILDEELTFHAITRSSTTLVIIGTPVKTIGTILKNLDDFGYNGWVTDLGSVKTDIHRVAELGNLHFFGGHPMAGSEKQGAEHYSPLLFQNAVFVLTGLPQLLPELVETYIQLIQAMGALPIQLSPDSHDRIAATISHLPQLMAVALVNQAVELSTSEPNTFQLAAGGFRDMTRIASSSPTIWKDILELNQPFILERIQLMIALFEQMKLMLTQSDLDSLIEEFNEAGKYRRMIPANTKGFISPLYDLFVFVDDRPGVIHHISGILFEASINIRDIELLKVREGMQGVFRLSFATENDWNSANDLLITNGFTTRKIT